MFKPREVMRILKAIAKQAANQENERKLLEAKREANQKIKERLISKGKRLKRKRLQRKKH